MKFQVQDKIFKDRQVAEVHSKIVNQPVKEINESFEDLNIMQQYPVIIDNKPITSDIDNAIIELFNLDVDLDDEDSIYEAAEKLKDKEIKVAVTCDYRGGERIIDTYLPYKKGEFDLTPILDYNDYPEFYEVEPIIDISNSKILDAITELQWNQVKQNQNQFHINSSYRENIEAALGKLYPTPTIIESNETSIKISKSGFDSWVVRDVFDQELSKKFPVQIEVKEDEYTISLNW